MVVASSGVSVKALPPPKLTPPDVAVPGMMSRLLAPMLSMVFCTETLAPWPISTTAIIAATPITMPRVVSPERMMFRPSDLKAITRTRYR